MKLLPKPINFKETFDCKGKTYYKTCANKYLVSISRDTSMPIFTKSNFCEVISKKEFTTAKNILLLGLDIKAGKRVQLTLF